MEGMKVTRDVITDLLPVYESGEASGDTRKLVDDFLAADHEFARLIERMKQKGLNGTRALPPPEVEMVSLQKTKRLMRQQQSCMAVAVFFSLAPFVFTFNEAGINWLLIRDAPVVGGAYLFTALIMWIAYFVTRRKLKAL